MNNKVLLFLLGIMFSGVGVYAQTVTVEKSGVTYSYDKSKIVTTSTGTVDKNTQASPKLTINRYTESFDGENYTYCTALIGTATVDHTVTNYGSVYTNAIRTVEITPKSTSKKEVVLQDFSEEFSDEETGNKYLNDTTVTSSTDEDQAEMNKIILASFDAPTSAQESNYIYTGARLKSMLGSSFASTVDYNGDALDEAYCYYYTTKKISKKLTVPSYVPVDEVTVCAFTKVSGVSGTINYVVKNIPANFIAGNTSVTKLTISENVETIAAGAFKGCTKLNTFVNNSETFTLASTKNGVSLLCNSGETEVIAAPANMSGVDTLTTTMTSVRDWAFWNVSLNGKDLTVWHYGDFSYCNGSTQGVTFKKIGDTSGENVINKKIITVNGVDVGIELSGKTTYSEFEALHDDGSLDAYSYVDMRKLEIDKSTVFDFWPMDNQMYIFGKLNDYNLDTSVDNYVYTNDSGALECQNYVLYPQSDLNQNVYIPEEFKAMNATIDREFDGTYASLVVPFAYDAVPDGFTAYYFKSYNPTKKQYTVGKIGLNNKTFEANVPYLVKGSGTLSGSATVKATTTTSYSTANMNGMTVTGVYSYTSGDQLDVVNDTIANSSLSGRDYFFATNGGLLKFGTANHLDAFRAYIHLPYSYLNSSSAKANIVDMTETGIEEVSTDSKSEYYSTSGVRQNSRRRGVNIVRTRNSDGSVEVTKTVIK